MSQYARSLIDEKKYIFKCPYRSDKGESCSAVWDYHLVKHVAALSNDEVKYLDENLGKIHTP